jgi:hypothetical protein
MDFLWQALSLLALIAGIFIGEFLSTRAFGRPKTKVLAIAEVLVFVAVLVLLTSSIYFMALDLGMMLATNFLAGAITAVVSRGISTGISLLATMPSIGLFQAYSREEKLLIRSAEALAARGFEPEDIKEIFRRAGFSGSSIEAIFRTHRFEHSVHPLVKEVARLEEEAASLRQQAGPVGPAQKQARQAAPARKAQAPGGIPGDIYEFLRKNRRKEFTGDQLREELDIGSTKDSGKVMVSNAVSELVEKGLVSARREGKFKFYSANS